MVLTGISIGDIVQIDIQGRIFYAKVVGFPAKGVSAGKIQFEPLSRNNSYRHANAEEVKEHYKLMGRPRGNGAARKKPAKPKAKAKSKAKPVKADNPFIRKARGG